MARPDDGRKKRGIQFDSPDEREVFHAKESWVPLVLGAIPFILLGIVLIIIAMTRPRQHWTLPNRFPEEQPSGKK